MEKNQQEFGNKKCCFYWAENIGGSIGNIPTSDSSTNIREKKLQMLNRFINAGV